MTKPSYPNSSFILLKVTKNTEELSEENFFTGTTHNYKRDIVKLKYCRPTGYIYHYIYCRSKEKKKVI